MDKRRIVKVKMGDIKLNPDLDAKPYQTLEQQKEIAKKVEQLQKQGQITPIRLYPGYTIINGHLRFYAAKKLGWKEINATIEPRPEEF